MPKAINNITAEDIDAFQRTPTLSSYQLKATKSAIYPGQQTHLGLIYCALKLNGEAGELAEHVGKAMRDDGLLPISYNEHNDEIADLYAMDMGSRRRELIIKEVGDVLWYLSAICNELRITLNDAALINLQKLSDRSERGKLQGSGDDR